MNMSVETAADGSRDRACRQFGTQFSYLPGNAETVTFRDRAMQAIKESGLPTRKVESMALHRSAATC
jgi:hypothetical protein